MLIYDKPIWSYGQELWGCAGKEDALFQLTGNYSLRPQNTCNRYSGQGLEKQANIISKLKIPTLSLLRLYRHLITWKIAHKSTRVMFCNFKKKQLLGCLASF